MAGEAEHLKSMLSGESRAYGFTIAFWGSGALLINEYGTPGLVEALSFGLGGVIGFGALALMTMRKDNSEEDSMLVLSTIHYLSALFPLVATQGIIELGLGEASTFLISGFSVAVLHNLLSLIEYDVAKLFTDLPG